MAQARRHATPLKPPALRRGDVVGIVAPASPLADSRQLHRGVRYLERTGYRVELGRHVQCSHRCFAGTDAERAEDLNAMARNPSVRAIFCLRGGYGSGRLLPLLDYAAFRRDPKILVGFSDLTAVQLALWRKIRLVTFSGPLVGVELASSPRHLTEEWLWDLLCSKRKSRVYKGTGTGRLQSLRPGLADGFLMPANLAVLLSLCATPYIPSLEGAILVLEDVAEAPYRLDRMFNQLKLAGILDRLAGLVTGSFTRCPTQQTGAGSFSVRQVLRHIAAKVPRPMAANLPYGHHPTRLTLPIGVQARLNVSRGTLQLLENAVT